MGVYLILLALAQVYYTRRYSAWSLETWRKSWVCGIAMFSAHLSFQMGLLVLLLINWERLLLTKFALKHHTSDNCQMAIGLLPGFLISCALGISNAYISTYNVLGPSSLCLFISLEQNVRPIQWIMLVYNLSILVVAISISLANIRFFIGKHDLEANRRREIHLIYRMVTNTVTTITCYCGQIALHACMLFGGCINSQWWINVQLVILITINILNPIINTFSKSLFINYIRSKLQPNN
jgi:hypothetical protein